MELLATLLLWLAIAPPPDVSLDDLSAFPSRCVAVEVTRATWAIHCDLERRQPLCPSGDAWHAYHAINRDAWRRWYVWDDLRLATDTGHTVEYRLTVLRRMREWLGEAYYHGEMPPPVPYSRLLSGSIGVK